MYTFEVENAIVNSEIFKIYLDNFILSPRFAKDFFVDFSSWLIFFFKRNTVARQLWIYTKFLKKLIINLWINIIFLKKNIYVLY